MKQPITRRQFVSLLPPAILAAPSLAQETAATAGGARPHSEDGSGAPVYIVLWFDTEDYILPASDDAALRIAAFLTKQGIRANFKVVGEKARVLEARHRTDVIAALKRHEIGYHSNTHSQQPTIAVYESVLDWEQGAQEFDRRERPGFDDVTRIFGRPPTCFGQPGTSWAPQSYPALKKWGIHVYLDDGKQVGLDGKPFWYGGLLNIFNIDAGRGLEQNEDWSNLAAAKDYFTNLHRQLTAQPAGGLVSFMFHPTQLISQRFWDAVNFSNGANPPRSEWNQQPQLTKAESEQAFHYFEQLIRYIQTFPNVRFITASEAQALYRDKAQARSFTPAELAAIAAKVTPQVSFQTRHDYALSASEVFTLLNSLVAEVARNQPTAPVALNGTPYGPASSAFDMDSVQVVEPSWSQFSRSVLDVQQFLDRDRQIPNTIWMGSGAVAPESYLLALASVAQALVNKQQPPASVKILPATLAAGQYVADDSTDIWKWPIFPPGFHAPHLMQLARLQAWTLKPAILPLTQ
jgi:hypothetical protein